MSQQQRENLYKQQPGKYKQRDESKSWDFCEQKYAMHIFPGTLSVLTKKCKQQKAGEKTKKRRQEEITETGKHKHVATPAIFLHKL